MAVVKPGEPFEIEQLRFADFAAYYRLVKRTLEETIATGPNNHTYPDPVPHCDICRWWSRCNKQRRDDDHLTFVAGIQKLQVNELNRQNVHTLTAFASAEEPLLRGRNAVRWRVSIVFTNRPRFSLRADYPINRNSNSSIWKRTEDS